MLKISREHFAKDQLVLEARRLTLRPLTSADFGQWTQVRQRCRKWLVQWEPRKPSNLGDPDIDPKSFQKRCGYLTQQRQKGVSYSFGIFLGDKFIGEMNMSSVTGHPFFSCYVGYWIDEKQAGNGYAPEALAAVLNFGFEELMLLRIQVAIVPTNEASLRVVQKLGMNYEGLLRKFLEINGIWEDHHLFAMTVEDWQQCAPRLMAEHLVSRHLVSGHLLAEPLVSGH